MFIALIFAAEGGHSSIDLVLPETAELVWGTIASLIVLIGVVIFAVPMIRKMVAEREAQVARDLNDAEAEKQAAVAERAEYQRQIADAKNEANRIIEEARQEAKLVRQDIISKAQDEANDLKARNAEDIQVAQRQAVSDLRHNVGGLAVELAEKVVQKNLDRETNMHLIEQFINQVGQGGTSEAGASV